MSVKLIQIDPEDCGCTECLTGEYVPLNYATMAQIVDAIEGYLSNATGLNNPELWEYAGNCYRMRNYY